MFEIIICLPGLLEEFLENLLILVPIKHVVIEHVVPDEFIGRIEVLVTLVIVQKDGVEVVTSLGLLVDGRSANAENVAIRR